MFANVIWWLGYITFDVKLACVVQHYRERTPNSRHTGKNRPQCPTKKRFSYRSASVCPLLWQQLSEKASLLPAKRRSEVIFLSQRRYPVILPRAALYFSLSREQITENQYRITR